MKNTDFSLRDVINALESEYELGVRLKQDSLRDFDKYTRGHYYPRNKVLIASGVPLNKHPPLKSRYEGWFKNILWTLSLPNVSKIYRGQLLDSRYGFDLDTTRDLKSIEDVYDKTLATLLKTIEALQEYQGKSIKTVSLKLLENALCIHIDPDDRNIPFHSFNSSSPLRQVFEYLYINQGRLVVSGEIVVTGQGASNKRNLSEDLRAMEINAELKRLFFVSSSADRVFFNNRVELDSDKLNELLTGLKTD